MKFPKISWPSEETISNFFDFMAIPFGVGAFTIFMIWSFHISTQIVMENACRNKLAIISADAPLGDLKRRYALKGCISALEKDKEVAERNKTLKFFVSYLECVEKSQTQDDLTFCAEYYVKEVEISRRN